MSLQPLKIGVFLFMEIWKDIKGYEGLYQVSNHGRVKSLWFGKERILKQSIRNIYYRVNLCKDASARNHDVHVLVSVAFLGHIQNGFKGLIVHHDDENPLNNYASNLQLITTGENVSKGYKSKGTYSKYRNVSWHKRDEKWVAYIRVGNKNKHLGSFKNEIHAHKAYQEALSKLK